LKVSATIQYNHLHIIMNSCESIRNTPNWLILDTTIKLDSGDDWIQYTAAVSGSYNCRRILNPTAAAFQFCRSVNCNFWTKIVQFLQKCNIKNDRFKRCIIFSLILNEWWKTLYKWKKWEYQIHLIISKFSANNPSLCCIQDLGKLWC
jgi:hypothetical protein